MSDRAVGYSPKAGYISDVIILEDHWKMVLSITGEDLTDGTNLGRLQTALMGLEAYLSDIIQNDAEYKEEISKIKEGKRGNKQAEIDRCIKFMAALRRVQGRSDKTAPEGADMVDDIEIPIKDG